MLTAATAVHPTCVKCCAIARAVQSEGALSSKFVEQGGWTFGGVFHCGHFVCKGKWANHGVLAPQWCGGLSLLWQDPAGASHWRMTNVTGTAYHGSRCCGPVACHGEGVNIVPADMLPVGCNRLIGLFV